MLCCPPTDPHTRPLAPYRRPTQILSLPCRHQYHADCVTQWLRFKGATATCPNCKGQVWKEETSFCLPP